MNQWWRRDPSSAPRLDTSKLGSLTCDEISASLGVGYRAFMVRDDYIKDFGFSVPCSEAVAWVRRYALDEHAGRVVEVGAGSGWWSKHLAEAGLDVVAYDDKSWAKEWRKSHFEVRTMDGAEAVLAHPDRLVFVSWPNYRSAFGYQVAQACREGQVLVYVGEGPGGCTGSLAMFDLFRSDFETLRGVEVPQFFGINDGMEVMRRVKPRPAAPPAGCACVFEHTCKRKITFEEDES